MNVLIAQQPHSSCCCSTDDEMARYPTACIGIIMDLGGSLRASVSVITVRSVILLRSAGGRRILYQS